MNADQLPEDTCPHLHLWDGSCVDCLTDVTWPGLHTVGHREARIRHALGRIRLNLALFGTVRSPWAPPPAPPHRTREDHPA